MAITEMVNRGKRAWFRGLAGLATAALALAALVGGGMGATGVHAAEPLHLSVQGPATVEGGFSVKYVWTLQASAPAAGIRLDLNMFNVLHPQLSVAGAGNFSCQPGQTSDFLEECTAAGMGAGQTTTFTVTGQAPLSGSIRGDASINIGNPPDSVAGISTTITAPAAQPGLRPLL